RSAMLLGVKTLVTGGAGFIGSHLTDRLLADGHEVTVLDDLSSGRPEKLRDASANIIGTVNVLEAGRRAGTRKVLLASSVAVYGPPDRVPVTESAPTNPL